MPSYRIDSDIIPGAGGLIWRWSAAGRQLAIVHRPKPNDWVLPKGKLEPGESWREAAVREVVEETGFQVQIDHFAGCICYLYNNVPKVVLFWNMTLSPSHSSFRPNDEVDQLQWLEPESALAWLSYQNERDLVLKNIHVAVEKIP